MPDNKRQHYVPKFYLRLYGYNEGASIDVFNIARGKLIRSASLKTQAYRDWFYGKELHLEKFFQFIEGKAGEAIARILATRTLPKRFSEDHHVLTLHCALQYGRTEAAEAVMNEQADKLARMLLAHHITDPELLSALPNVKISLTNAVVDSVRHSISTAPLLFDLRYKLIVNRSSKAFITSDAPVIFHNDWLHGLGRNTGLATAGLQMVLPLGPWLCLLFYDEAVYAVGKPTSNFVSLLNPAHVTLFNDLQWESAHANLYVSPETVDNELEAEVSRTSTLRKKEWVEIGEDILEQAETRKSIALSFGRVPSAVDLRLPFIRLLEPRLSSIGAFEVPNVRSADIVAIVKEAGEALDSRALSLPEFLGATAAGVVRSQRQRRGR